MKSLRTAVRRPLAAALALALACPGGLAAPSLAAGASATVDGISVGDDAVTIRLSAATPYNGFLTANPPRLVVELLDAENQVGVQQMAGKGRLLRRVRAAQFQRSPRMISRVVLDLKEMAGYRLTQSGHNLVVELAAEPGAAEPAAAAAVPVSSPTLAVASEPPTPRKPRRKPAVKPKPAVVEAVAPVPAKTEAAPEVAEPSAETASAELAAMATPAEHGESEEEPATPAPAIKRSMHVDLINRLPRDLVSMDFDATDLRDVFKLLSAKARVNIIYGDDVAALPPLTLHLSDVPFNEAMDTIMSMTGLVTAQVGANILRMMTPARLAQERRNATTVTEVVPLNYTKATDLLAEINSLRTAEGRSGAASVDPKTNSLILTESPDGMATERRIIAQLDVRPKQVLIEAKLVEVSLNNGLDYGVQWNYLELERGKAFGKNGTTSIGGPLGQINTPLPLGALDSNAGVGTASGPSGLQVPAGSQGGTGVNLPAANVLGALTLGRITNNQIFNLTLTAAASQGKVKVLSDPKVATLNNQPANINVTTQYPYVTAIVSPTAGSTQQQVTYVSVGIQLTVTPTINADGRITLNINPSVSQPSATAPTVGGAPGIDQRTAQTTILVRDAETIVIGGLISDHNENQVSKIPILGDIPLLGFLFRSKHVAHTRTELLIFVTPKILAD